MRLEPRPLPHATRVQLGHVMCMECPQPHPQQRSSARASEAFKTRSSSSGSLQPTFSFYQHREQLSRAGVGPLPTHLVTSVNTRAEEIVHQLEQESSQTVEPRPVSLPSLRVSTLLQHCAGPASLPPPVPLCPSAQEALHHSSMSTHPTAEQTPSHPHLSTLPTEEEGCEGEELAAKQEILVELDKVSSLFVLPSPTLSYPPPLPPPPDPPHPWL